MMGRILNILAMGNWIKAINKRNGFAVLLLCGPLVLSGCAETETQVAETTIEKLESPVNIATSAPEPNPVPMYKLQDCKFKGKKLSGKVYFTDDPLNGSFGMRPNLFIYETSNTLESELGIYLSTLPQPSTGECGVWSVLSSPIGADWIVYRTDSPSNLYVNFDGEADINVTFVSNVLYAGLN